MPPYDESQLGLGINDPAYLDLVTKQQEALSRANQPYGMNAGQGAIAAGLGLLPALIGGLVRGKEGVGIGARAGMGAVGMYDNTLESNFQRASENEKANAALYGAQANQVLQSDLGFNKFLRQENIKQDNRKEMAQLDPRSSNITVNMPGALDKDTRKDVSPDFDLYQSFTQSINAGKSILEKNPQLAAMSYDNPEATLKTLGTGAEAWVKGGETALGEFRTQAKIAASDYIYATSGASSTKEEFKRKYDSLTGDGAVFATPKTTLQFLNNIRQRYKEAALRETAEGMRVTGKSASMVEAMKSPQFLAATEILDSIDKGMFSGGTGYNVVNKEGPKTMTGPKGTFTVGK